LFSVFEKKLEKKKKRKKIRFKKNLIFLY